MSSVDGELFDYVLVVSLENRNGKATPYLDYRFPTALQSTSNNTKKDSLADDILQFCYPEADQWLDPKIIQQKKQESESFSFVMTDQNANRRFGYCRRIIAKNKKNEDSPECYVIISFLPSMSLFTNMLNIIEQLRKKQSSSSVFAFLKSVLAKSFPNPGDSLVCRTFEGEEFTLTRSDNDFLLDFVSFKNLFQILDVSQVLDIFSAVLTESRIIICSKSITSLSSAFHAISALIYPFTWQHVYIPILPKSLVSYCCAPMPFLVGVLEANLSELFTYPLEEAVLLDVDTGKYLRDLPPTCNYKKVLPSGPAETLKKQIQSVLKNSSGKELDLAISQAFLSFMYTLFSGFETYATKTKFEREKFLKNRGSEFSKFFEKLSETQMYEMFIKDIETLAKNNKLDMCILSKAKFVDLSVRTNENVGSKDMPSSVCSRCNKFTSDLTFKHGSYLCKDCYKDYKKEKKEKQKIANEGKSKTERVLSFMDKFLRRSDEPDVQEKVEESEVANKKEMFEKLDRGESSSSLNSDKDKKEKDKDKKQKKETKSLVGAFLSSPTTQKSDTHERKPSGSALEKRASTVSLGKFDPSPTSSGSSSPSINHTQNNASNATSSTNPLSNSGNTVVVSNTKEAQFLKELPAVPPRKPGERPVSDIVFASKKEPDPKRASMITSPVNGGGGSATNTPTKLAILKPVFCGDCGAKLVDSKCPSGHK